MPRSARWASSSTFSYDCLHASFSPDSRTMSTGPNLWTMARSGRKYADAAMTVRIGWRASNQSTVSTLLARSPDSVSPGSCHQVLSLLIISRHALAFENPTDLHIAEVEKPCQLCLCHQPVVVEPMDFFIAYHSFMCFHIVIHIQADMFYLVK